MENGTWAEGVWEWTAEEYIWAKAGEVIGEWRKLQNEELCDLYSSTDIIGWSNQEKWDGRGM